MVLITALSLAIIDNTDHMKTKIRAITINMIMIMTIMDNMYGMENDNNR